MLISCKAKEWLSYFSNPKLATILLTYSCKNNCIFCGPASKRQSSSCTNMDSDLVLEWIDRCAINGVKLLVFSGAGDPISHPDIELFIEKSIDLGISPYCFTTAQFCTSEKVHSIFKSGLRDILVSIHGHNAEVHEASTRSIGSFNKTLTGLINLIESGFYIQSNTVISNININYLVDIIGFLITDLNIDEIALSYPRYEGNALRNTHAIPSYEDVSPLINAELPRFLDKKKFIVIENIPPCYIPNSSYCSMPDYPIMYKDIEFDLTAKSSEVGMFKPLECEGCSIICPGIDKMYPHKFTPGYLKK